MRRQTGRLGAGVASASSPGRSQRCPLVSGTGARVRCPGPGCDEGAGQEGTAPQQQGGESRAVTLAPGSPPAPSFPQQQT